MSLKSTTTDGFNFRIINSLIESWGVRLTWLDCKQWAKIQTNLIVNACCILHEHFQIVPASTRWLNTVGHRGWNRTNVPIDINPFIIHPAHEWLYHTTEVYAYAFTISSVGSFTSHKNQNSERAVRRGPMVFCPYPRRLECLTICRWSGWGLDLRPPARQTSAKPVELTGRRLLTNQRNKPCPIIRDISN